MANNGTQISDMTPVAFDDAPEDATLPWVVETTGGGYSNQVNYRTSLVGPIRERPTSAVLADDAGASLIGSNDGQSGSLWTTVAGFISYLLSTAGSNIVGFLQSGTGAVASTVQKELRYFVRPEQFGATGSGANEITQLQNAFNAAATLGVPILITKKHYIVPPNVSGGRGIIVSSNMTIIFEGDGEIENLAHNLDRYEMLYLSAVENVRIVSPRLNGRRDLNTSPSGEFGNGIQVLGACKNIRIDNPVTVNMWGDGIFIGQELFASPFAVPQDVTVTGHIADNCRRQGMTITGGERINVSDARWTSTNGTAPAYGMDIEPDRSDSKLTAIRVVNAYTGGNAGGGILVYLGALRASSTPVDITIENHTSLVDSAAGFRCWKSGTTNDNATGAVRYLNGRITQPGTAGIVVQDWDSRGPLVVLDGPEILNPNESNSSADTDKCGVCVFVDSSDLAVNGGNVVLSNFTIIDTRGTTRMSKWLYFRSLKGLGRIDKIKVYNPLTLTASTSLGSWLDCLGSFVDTVEVAKLFATASDSIGPNIYGSVYSTQGAGGTVTLDLSAFFSAGCPDMTFAADGTTLVLNPDDASSILPGGGAGKTLTIAAKGRVCLRRTSSTTWQIISAFGTLTFEP